MNENPKKPGWCRVLEWVFDGLDLVDFFRSVFEFLGELLGGLFS
jgi:hypothetical protein